MVLLDRLNFSWISCRSKHPKSSQDTIDNFKKDFPDLAKEVIKINPKIKYEVWWQDEMRVGQQGSLSRVWAQKGTRPRVVRQRQFLSTYIFGACCPAKDKACGLILPRVGTDMMLLPPYSPELNPMEQVWQQLRKIKLSNACYKDYEEILSAAVEAWTTFTDKEGVVNRLCFRDWAKIQY